jgi:hypothetical protein
MACGEPFDPSAFPQCSAAEVISEIKKLPKVQQRRIFRFVNEELRAEEDRHDNELAEAALKEKGANILWSQARKKARAQGGRSGSQFTIRIAERGQ